MKAIIEQRPCKIWFSYQKRGDKYDRTEHVLTDTICTIYHFHAEHKISGRLRKSYYSEEATGFAKQSHLDTYNKYYGIKLSFGRAIQKYPKFIRAQFWKAFKEHFKKHYDFPDK